MCQILTQVTFDSLFFANAIQPHQGGVANMMEYVGHDLHWLLAAKGDAKFIFNLKYIDTCSLYGTYTSDLV